MHMVSCRVEGTPRVKSKGVEQVCLLYQKSFGMLSVDQVSKISLLYDLKKRKFGANSTFSFLFNPKLREHDSLNCFRDNYFLIYKLG